MKPSGFIFLFLLLALFLSTIPVTASIIQVQAENTPTYKVVSGAVVISIDGMIDSSTQEYVENAIKYAEETNSILIIELNTPGGFLDPAMNIVIDIDKASVPVVGYVVDKWAESAGTLILVSCHIAAMQPYTQIGSMQPIEYDPTTGSYKPVNESKIINPILKFLDDHAGTKGRNTTILHRFVTENLNLGAEEALKYGVINLIASDLTDLLEKINGTNVNLTSGYVVRIDLHSLNVERYEPSPRQAVVHALSDPIISGLLLSLGVMIVVFSVLSGHAAFLGLGALLVLLGLVGSGYSVNTTVLLLMVIGAVLLVIELYTPGFGLIGGTGIVMLTLGLILVPTSGNISISKSYANQLLYGIYALGIGIGAFFAFIIYKIVRIRRKPSFEWKLEGGIGKAVTDLEPGKEGFVLIEGEYWKATSSESIRKGEEVVVIGRKGLVLIVRRKESTE
ncbi:MAG: nodulation protein NfeD [Desulfurococcales archaeon]|nr:nodulation protein NfeD [Desulfurococcales archaeon]